MGEEISKSIIHKKTIDMEQDQKGQASNEQQSGSGEQNPTLHEKGSEVADYGNVMGGSSDGNVQEEQSGSQQSNENRSGADSNSTVGNP